MAGLADGPRGRGPGKERRAWRRGCAGEQGPPHVWRASCGEAVEGRCCVVPGSGAAVRRVADVQRPVPRLDPEDAAHRPTAPSRLRPL